jgi:hypothetical protein
VEEEKAMEKVNPKSAAEREEEEEEEQKGGTTATAIERCSEACRAAASPWKTGMQSPWVSRLLSEEG